LPDNAPKHLLGVGTPLDIVQAVARGCDTFDCVIPTREARHGRLYISAKWSVDSEQREGYSTLNINNEKYKEDFTPVDNTCDCYLCLNHTKSYLRHLFATGEPLAIRLATMHNLKFYLNLMAKIRQAITYDYFEDMVAEYREVASSR
jgi:queuine tRNA-ribosyltransferase